MPALSFMFPFFGSPQLLSLGSPRSSVLDWREEVKLPESRVEVRDSLQLQFMRKKRERELRERDKGE
jgi:hypothetical protein